MLIAVAVGTVAILPAFLTGAVSVQIRRELELEVSGVGLAVGTFFLVAALGSGPGGAVAQRIGAMAAMRLAALVGAASLAGVGLLGRSFASLVAPLALGGLATALAQPATNLFLAEQAPEHRRGLVFGLKQAAIPAAVLLSGLSVPLVALTVGWRWTYGLGAFAALAVALLLGRATPAPAGARPELRPAGGSRPRGPLRALALVAVLATAGPNALGAYLVTTAVAVDIGEGEAGILLAACSAVSIFARVFAGWLADHAASHRLTPMAFMLVGGAAGFGLLAIPDPVPVVLGALLAFGFGWGWPGLFNLSVVSRHLDAPAAASGITQTGVYAGAAAGPFAFGLLASAFSLVTAWAAAGAVALAAAALAGWVERRYQTLEAP